MLYASFLSLSFGSWDWRAQINPGSLNHQKCQTAILWRPQSLTDAKSSLAALYNPNRDHRKKNPTNYNFMHKNVSNPKNAWAFLWCMKMHAYSCWNVEIQIPNMISTLCFESFYCNLGFNMCSWRLNCALQFEEINFFDFVIVDFTDSNPLEILEYSTK